MKWLSFEATASVAYKEFLHIYRDRRVLLLVLLLPPLFTLLFGHAFETSELTGVPSFLIDRDSTPRRHLEAESLENRLSLGAGTQMPPYSGRFVATRETGCCSY